MLNIVIPMAGRGSRFQKAGYTLPKPLIPVLGKPMISLVIGNLRPRVPHRFIFIVLADHIEQYQIDQQLRQWVPNCEVVVVDQVTEGAACTVLLAKAFINTDQPLMIANSDQWVDIDVNDYLNHMEAELADGLIMTMTANDPKWSFVKFDPQGRVVAVVEKQVVSQEATVGIYNYRRGRDFVTAAEAMIARDFRVNGEFYVAPAYDEMVARGMSLVCYNIGSEANGMYGLGIPADLDLFLSLPVSQKAAAGAV
ncbi:MAG: NTP transferase domain-containing protein [Oscillatoriales cyanobacterium SM2_2_1]|nr:NTP transferase domain-containing protein [Oscillatoriales cyanobacterium SM2_2_1]